MHAGTIYITLTPPYNCSQTPGSDELIPTVVTFLKADGSLQVDGSDAMLDSIPSLSPAAGDILARFRQWSNPAFAQMVKGIAEIQGDTMRYHSLPFLLLMG